MGVSKNRGSPKWMVYNGTPLFKINDLGGKPTIFGNIQIPFKGSWENDVPFPVWWDIYVSSQEGFRVPIEPCLALLNDEAWISQVNFFRDFFWGNRSLLRIKVRIPQILKAFPTEDALFEMSSGGEDGYFRTFPLPVEPKCCISLGTNPAGP